MSVHVNVRVRVTPRRFWPIARHVANAAAAIGLDALAGWIRRRSFRVTAIG